MDELIRGLLSFLGAVVAQLTHEMNARVALESLDGLGEKLTFQRTNELRSHSMLELENKACANAANDIRGASLLAMSNLREIELIVFRDEVNGATAGAARGELAIEQELLGSEDTRGTRASNHFVRRNEEGINMDQAAVLFRRSHRVHVNLLIGGSSSEIPKGESAVGVKKDIDRSNLLQDSSDVGTGGEGTDDKRSLLSRFYGKGRLRSGMECCKENPKSLAKKVDAYLQKDHQRLRTSSREFQEQQYR